MDVKDAPDASPSAHVSDASTSQGTTSSHVTNVISSCNKDLSKYFTTQLNKCKQPFSCVKCSAKFARKDDLDLHMVTHSCKSKEKPFSCEICSKTFASKSNLTRHQQSHTPSKFSCSECKETFSRKEKLVLHLKTHNSPQATGKLFSCELCSKTFARQDTLRRHEKTHTPKKWSCGNCSVEFQRKDALERHKQTAHPSPVSSKWSCSNCSKTYSRKDSLQRHQQTVHASPISPSKWSCLKCPETFDRKDSLERHQQTVHASFISPSKWSCPKCPETFGRKDNLHTHKRKAHGQTRLEIFRSSVEDGCTYVCSSCHRLLFSSGVKATELDQSLLDKFIVNPSQPVSKHLCHTCSRYIVKGKLPPMSVLNGLQITPLKDHNGTLISLTDLEAILIAKNILFMKIFMTPISRWSGMKDKVVNVPINESAIVQTVKKLPRLPSQASVIPIQLKRRMQYKAVHLTQYIRPEMLRNALQAFVALGNEFYQGVEIDSNYADLLQIEWDHGDDFENSLELSLENDTDIENDIDFSIDTPLASYGSSEVTAVLSNMIDNIVCAEDVETISELMTNLIEAVESQEEDVVKKWQYGHDDDIYLNRMIPESNVESFPVAPGEGQTPINLLQDKNWDVKAYPHLFPDGKYGLHHPREVRLTPLQYFQQRLYNVNNQFVRSSNFGYSAMAYLEMQQLLRNERLSYCRGKASTNNGVTTMSLDDGFAVLDNIKNSPKYHQSSRYEMIAKLENLGPFQFFFTLSCAERRWVENLRSLFHGKVPHDAVFSVVYGDKSNDNNCSLCIDGIPWFDYLTQHDIRIDIEEEMRKSVLMLTRNFAHRVKMFFQHFVMHSSNPMHVNFYNYKVEFQMRGAPHIHGVLWLDLQAVERDELGHIITDTDVNGETTARLVFPGVNDIMMKIKHEQELFEEEKGILASFADKFVSVSLEDSSTVDIVKKVNVHRHSKTCFKHNPEQCRFHFPKFPTNETIIAVPYKFMRKDSGDLMTEEEQLKSYKKLQKCLTKVRNVLLNQTEMEEIQKLPVHQQIPSLCGKAKITTAKYALALRYAGEHYSVHYKRTVNEIYVNSYNPEWIEAWNGNMDIQVCLDYYSIITYITDYVTKTDNQLMFHLIKALKENKGSSKLDKMKAIKNTFLTHRQIGESEMYYRINPEMHLKDSNVKCVFVSTAQPDNRSRFLQKVNEDERKFLDESQLVHIDGKDGSYKVKESIIDKYIKRPLPLSKMCLMQFAKMYQPVNSVPKNTTWTNNVSTGMGYVAEETDVEKLQNNRHRNYTKFLIHEGMREDTDESLLKLLLPKYIRLENSHKQEYMALRTYPYVIRLHKFNKDDIDYIYSELLLYKPFHSEDEFQVHDLKKCADIYMTSSSGDDTAVSFVKKILMPHIEGVEEGRLKAAEILNEERGAIGVDLDPTVEQMNDLEEDVVDHPSYAVLYDSDIIDSATRSRSKTPYCKIKLDDESTLLHETRLLDEEQQLVLEKAVSYCNAFVRAKQNNTILPQAPHIVVHGGAGTGKSAVIKVISQWMERILRQPGDNPDKPYILITAPTGTCASAINGSTLHSTFGFNFGNAYYPLSDEARDKKRKDLENLVVVIIDEVSMVKADLLYQLNLRLQEVKCNNLDFGGVAMFMFGDILQLPPVKAQFIFLQPKCSDYHYAFHLASLWESFEVINLVKNHRQGEDKVYADLLNRIRVGLATDHDFQLLQTKVRPQGHPDLEDSNAFYVACINDVVNERNEAQYNKLNSPTFVFKAVNIEATNRTYKPTVVKGLIRSTAFRNELYLKIGAPVMHIHNTDVSDCLSNGCLGTVVGFERNSSNEIQYVMVQFANERCGRCLREEKISHVNKYPGSATPVSRVQFEYSLSSSDASARAKLIQFPFRLAWASTAHKFQGANVHKPRRMIVDFTGLREKAQGYVMLSRVQELEQLIIKEDIPIRLIVPHPDALKELERMNKVALNNVLSCKYPVSLLSGQSLIDYIKNL